MEDGETAELLKDPLVAKSSTWNLSTSQIYIKHGPAYGEPLCISPFVMFDLVPLAGWGPVVADGYGQPYMIHPDCLQFVVTSRKEMPSATYLRNLEKAADLLMDVMMRAKETKL